MEQNLKKTKLEREREKLERLKKDTLNMQKNLKILEQKEMKKLNERKIKAFNLIALLENLNNKEKIFLMAGLGEYVTYLEKNEITDLIESGKKLIKLNTIDIPQLMNQKEE